MALHYKEGHDTKNALDAVQLILLAYSPFAIIQVEDLRRVEFALYGLALDYGRIDFKKSVLAANCAGGDCVWLPQTKRAVTLCGHCIDSSDMGNMMFGLGGKVRGFSSAETRIEAYGFNVMTFLKKLKGNEKNPPKVDFSALSPIDSRGIYPGYRIAETQAFNSEKTFCQIINESRSSGYNDNADIVNGLNPNYGSITEDDLSQKLIGPRYSFLNRWSDNRSTIDLLLHGGQ